MIMQSKRREAHESYISALSADGRVFRCLCTRATLGHLGQCESDCQLSQHNEGSRRLALPGETLSGFNDLVLGSQAPTDMPQNFVVKRRDGLLAYQLATAVDDIDEGYTHIIRGSDLLSSTFRQMAIHSALGQTSPKYGHLPIATDPMGNKLSKQTGAPAIDTKTPVENLRSALAFLNQTPPPPSCKTPTDLLTFGAEHWNLARTGTSQM